MEGWAVDIYEKYKTDGIPPLTLSLMHGIVSIVDVALILKSSKVLWLGLGEEVG